MEHHDHVFSVFIAEDEVPARELLVDYILTRPELKLSGIARDGEDAFRKLSDQEYDLVFMDINLPRLSGIEVLDRLKMAPYVIFTTAYEQYALHAFDIGAVDFLRKPFDCERFNRAIRRFLDLKGGGTSDQCGQSGVAEIGLSYRDGGRYHILPYAEIVYACSRGKNSIIHTVSGAVEVPIILKELEQKFPPDIFARIHKQHLVNIRFITALEYYIGGQYIAYLKDDDDSTLPVGRKYAPFLKTRLNMV